MKKTGIINAELIAQLTKMRHTDKFMLCDVGFPVPEGKMLVDISLVAGLPTIEQVFRAVCNDILIESITVPAGFPKVRPIFFGELETTFVNQEISQISSVELMTRAYDPDVKLFIRTGEVRPEGNMLLSSASGVPRVFDMLNVEFPDVIG